MHPHVHGCAVSLPQPIRVIGAFAPLERFCESEYAQAH